MVVSGWMYSGSYVLGYWVDLVYVLFKSLKIFENLFVFDSSACLLHMFVASSRHATCIFATHRKI
jgi:hypothetical protein